MFIANAESIKRTVLLDKEVGEYLVTHGIPLLSYQDDKYVFAKTTKLAKALKIFKKKGGGLN
jgi:hypothetical protein